MANTLLFIAVVYLLLIINHIFLMTKLHRYLVILNTASLLPPQDLSASPPHKYSVQLSIAIIFHLNMLLFHRSRYLDITEFLTHSTRNPDS